MHGRRSVHGLLDVAVRVGGRVRMIAMLYHGHRLMHLRRGGVPHAARQASNGLSVSSVVKGGRSLGRVTGRGVRRVRGNAAFGPIFRLDPIVVWDVKILRVLRRRHVMGGLRVVGNLVLGLHNSGRMGCF